MLRGGLRDGVENLTNEGLLLHCLFCRGGLGEGLLSAEAQREKVSLLELVATELSTDFHCDDQSC